MAKAMADIERVKADMLAKGNAPVAKKVPFSQEVPVPEGRGEAAQTYVLEDEYHWIQGKSWPTKTVEDEDIIGYLNEENTYCKDFMDALDEKKTVYYETLKGRIKLSDRTLEAKQGKYYYYSRTEETLQYSIECRRPEGSEVEEVLLDKNELAEGQKFSKALDCKVSADGKLLAYKCDFVGDENYRLRFLDLASRAYLPDEIWKVSSSCFREDPSREAPAQGVFYSLRNEQLRPTKIFYHKFGTEIAEDKLLFEAKNDMFTVGVSRTADRRYVLVKHGSSNENETYAIAMGDESLTLKVLRPMVDDVEYRADHGGGFWYINTKEGCKMDHLRILRSAQDLATLEGEAAAGGLEFTVNVEEDPELCLKMDLTLTKDHLCLEYLSAKTGQPKAVVRKIDAELGAPFHTVAFPGVDPERTSHEAEFSHTTCYEEALIQVAVDTPCQPTRWYRYSHGEGAEKMELLKTKEVPNYDPELYATERIYVEYTEDPAQALHPSVVEEEKAKNRGTASIPVTILYKKAHFVKDGSMPLLLCGYGSYGIPTGVFWKNFDTIFADLGFVVARAHIRGGGCLGEPWYQAAKFLTKKRTFIDFVKCAERLAADKYTSEGNIAIRGGSAGGMLVGACLNMRPELFKAVVANVPFVTVLDTMLDGSLPLTPGEFKEWGNPRDAGYYEYIRSYCPYMNVAAKAHLQQGGRFPSIFASTGLTDYRVGYYEGAKWVARLRAQIAEAKQASSNGLKDVEPLLVIETNMTAGHAGASGRFDYLKELSREVAFLASEFQKGELS